MGNGFGFLFISGIYLIESLCQQHHPGVTPLAVFRIVAPFSTSL